MTEEHSTHGTGANSETPADEETTDGPAAATGVLSRREVLGVLATLGVVGAASQSASAGSTTLEFGGNYTGDPGANYGLWLAPDNARFGMLGVTETGDGRGLVGRATATSGATIGVLGRAESPGGVAVQGQNDATSGPAYGGFFRTFSPAGRGFLGIAEADSGNTFGAIGKSRSPSGTGAEGNATAGSGTTYGVVGRANSPDGVAVSGRNTASSGQTIGVEGVTRSDTDGTAGVEGRADAASGATYGVAGFNDSAGDGSAAVYGEITAGDEISFTTGVYGTDPTEFGTGVFGVLGEAEASSGVNYGVFEETRSADGYGVFSNGRLAAIRDVREQGATNLGRHVATVQNTSGEDGGDVLGLKTNVTDPSEFTNYVSFLDVDSQIGQIEGNGSGGVSYTSASSDVAEYFPTREPEAAFEAGDVVGLEAGEVVADPTAADQALVVSTAPTVRTAG